jgi:hypothetical protein
MFEDGVSERAASIALELSKYDGLKNAVDAIQAAATK